MKAEKGAALELSNAVNAAYKTLTSPLHRVEYILRRNGVETGEEDQLDDIELISEIMGTREEIDNVQPGNAERLLALRDENNSKCAALAMDACANVFLRKQKYPRSQGRSRNWLQGRIGRRRGGLLLD